MNVDRNTGLGSLCLTKSAITAVTMGYIAGCVVKWMIPRAPVTPLGCAVSAMYTIPVAFGSGYVAGKIASLINEKFEPYAQIGCFLVSGYLWIAFGSLAFSASPILASSVIAATIVGTLAIDYFIARKPSASTQT